MRATQREQEILGLLREAGSGRIADFSRRLGVSEETVRRAVQRLESRGLVQRVHGGAALTGWPPEPSLDQRMAENPAAKETIARAVADLLPDGSSLFLDVGSTTAYVARALRARRELVVVTNSIAVAQALATRNGNRVFMAGGELRAHDGGAFGAEALAFVRQFRVDYAVLSAAAITAGAGFLLHDLREAEFSRAIIEGAGQSIVAADASKFARSAPIRIAPPDRFARLVTDAPPPPDIAAMLAAAGVAVTVASG
jgi:DeoR family glycerol-3-phosphate regulon repressor